MDIDQGDDTDKLHSIWKLFFDISKFENLSLYKVDYVNKACKQRHIHVSYAISSSSINCLWARKHPILYINNFSQSDPDAWSLKRTPNLGLLLDDKWHRCPRQGIKLFILCEEALPHQIDTYKRQKIQKT